MESMNLYAYLFSFSVTVAILGYLAFFYLKRNRFFEKKYVPVEKPRVIQRNATASVANRQKIKTLGRMQIKDDSEDDTDEDLPRSPEKKIGTKKAKKLEEKKLKKDQREQEEREREIKKKEDELKSQQEKQDKESQEKLLKDQEELLELQRLEEERKENEIYEMLKTDFTIEEEGILDLESVNNSEQILDQKIISFFQENKCGMVEELSGLLNIKIQVCVDRIKALMKEKRLTGLLDDRGKFIYITEDEYAKICKYIRQRGRITIKELVENSNNLIKF